MALFSQNFTLTHFVFVRLGFDFVGTQVVHNSRCPEGVQKLRVLNLWATTALEKTAYVFIHFYFSSLITYNSDKP